MLYYWQTKYTPLIYITFFIFPHNRHFLVHISPIRRHWRTAFWIASVFPSLKCFTHLRTLLAPMHTHFHKHAEVSGEFLQQGFPFSQRIRWQHAGETKQLLMTFDTSLVLRNPPLSNGRVNKWCLNFTTLKSRTSSYCIIFEKVVLLRCYAASIGG